jgi:hypothetical protein
MRCGCCNPLAGCRSRLASHPVEPNMLTALFNSFGRTAEPSAQTDRPGPLPLDPQLLEAVVGGLGEGDGSPKGRWSPIEPTSEDDASSPKGRW